MRFFVFSVFFANFLFSEFKGSTDFLICDDNSNILFYKVDELKLMLNITNKYFFKKSEIKNPQHDYIDFIDYIYWYWVQ